MLGPNSPLGQQTQLILKEHPEGLTPEDIEIQLRQEGFQASMATIKKVLSHTDVFVPVSGGRYALRISPWAAAIQLRPALEESLAMLRPPLRRIARTHWLIDFIVYRLYGLTEEEVAVVEENRS